MGTRADFYVGRGTNAEWLGSIGWDGYEDGITSDVLHAKDEASFRREVDTFLAGRDDATRPADGWPWPWDDSALTDCSYWFFDGCVWDAHHEYEPVGGVFAPFTPDRPTWDGKEDEPEFYERWLRGKPTVEYPDMSARKNMTLGKRSGVMVFTAS